MWVVGREEGGRLAGSNNLVCLLVWGLFQLQCLYLGFVFWHFSFNHTSLLIHTHKTVRLGVQSQLLNSKIQAIFKNQYQGT